MLGVTLAPTIVSASEKINVIPSRAELKVDCRTPPGMGPAAARERIEAVLAGAGVDGWSIAFDEEVVGNGSPADTPLMDAIRGWVGREVPEATVLPTMLPAFTDSRTFRAAFGDCVAYGFFPHRHMTVYETASLLHAKDERIDVRDLGLRHALLPRHRPGAPRWLRRRSSASAAWPWPTGCSCTARPTGPPRCVAPTARSAWPRGASRACAGASSACPGRAAWCAWVRRWRSSRWSSGRCPRRGCPSRTGAWWPRPSPRRWAAPCCASAPAGGWAARRRSRRSPWSPRSSRCGRVTSPPTTASSTRRSPPTSATTPTRATPPRSTTAAAPTSWRRCWPPTSRAPPCCAGRWSGPRSSPTPRCPSCRSAPRWRSSPGPSAMPARARRRCCAGRATSCSGPSARASRPRPSSRSAAPRSPRSCAWRST